MDEKKKINLLLAALFVIIISGVIAILSTSSPSPKEIIEIPYQFSVQPTLGIVGDTDLLYFGGGPADAKLERTVDLKARKATKVLITATGPAELVVDKNNIILDETQSTTISFALIIPDLEEGTYEGKVFFSFFEHK